MNKTEEPKIEEPEEPSEVSLAWEAWRAENRRLILAGWTLGTEFGLDGTIRHYATKEGVWIDNEPPGWEEEELTP